MLAKKLKIVDHPLIGTVMGLFSWHVFFKICDHLSENPHSLHKYAYWKKLSLKLRMLLENIYKDWWGQQSAKEASNQQKLYTILLAWLWRVWKSLFCFRSLNGECVTCVCLQCSKHKQNRYRFLGKTATLGESTVSLTHWRPNFPRLPAELPNFVIPSTLYAKPLGNHGSKHSL